MVFVMLYFINKEDSFIDILVFIYLIVDLGIGSFGYIGFIIVEFLYCVVGFKFFLNFLLFLFDIFGNILF